MHLGYRVENVGACKNLDNCEGVRVGLREIHVRTLGGSQRVLFTGKKISRAVAQRLTCGIYQSLFISQYYQFSE